MKNLFERLQLLSKYNFSTISGFNDGEKFFLPSILGGKTVVICPKSSTENYTQQLLGLNKRVVCLENKIPLLYGFNESKSQIFKEYYLAISKIVDEDYDVVVVTPEVLFQKLPNADYILKSILNLSTGKSFNIEDLTSQLGLMGYLRQDLVSSPGEFSVRGDIVDIFATNYSRVLRINFFDTEIESMHFLNQTTYKQEESLESAKIFCNSFFSLGLEEKQNVILNVNNSLKKLSLKPEAMLSISNIVANQIEMLENNLGGISSVFFLPFCSYFNYSLFDFFGKNTTFVIDEPKLVYDKILEVEEENTNSFLQLSISGQLLPKTMDFYLQKKEIFAGFKNIKAIALSRIISQNKFFASDYSLNFICNRTKKYFNHFVELCEDCKDYLRNKCTVFLSCGTPITLNKIKNFFDQSNVEYEIVEDFSSLIPGKINLSACNIPYSCNFEMEKFLLIGSFNLNNEQIFINANNKEEQKSRFLPQIGDYVVHSVHGIGKCLGIQNLKLTNFKKDYIVVEYKDGDILYVPSENTDMLSAYVGDTPKCNKIGGTEFFKVKQKVKNSIKEMAFDLIKVYSDRMNLKGFKYSQDSYLQQDFENAFLFNYTQDQLTAIKEIKQDMESGKIMDRLLCGDVGFGKTEVALVAAFKAIQDGKQVAIICPTTILCEQHYNTALSRMKNFMVNVGVINRFKTKQEQDKILKDLKSGKIDLICGTHRLFSQDVQFKDLGLIILDEEQRFGVEDKERLKNIKKTVDVLSLSATPIPRTLYMSLTGIRDVSFLSTPPINRKKIQTTVVDYSDSMLVDCCRREVDRDGQVLIVYNRVESIANFYAHVKALLPDVKIGFAHGQMSPKQLEQAIFDLYTRKTQILISTILIENGIDLPFANTLFVVDSDKLGLSQLYQLRGRIGRSNIEAYCYFTFSKNKVLTEDAYKRLDAIMEFSDFGSGYKIALRDLEIRGAGDVLGKIQHGHMQQVGYDMYVKLLNETINEIKGNQNEELIDTKVDVSLNAYLPQNYISSNEQRIVLYTKISKLSSVQELNTLVEQTKDVYGNVPEPVLELCKIGLIKNLAQKLYITHIKLDDFSCKLFLSEEVKNKKIFGYYSSNSTDFVLTNEKLPIITLRKQNNVYSSQEFLLNFLLKSLEIKNKQLQ